MDFMQNFSPEEILRKKELDGGIEYDPIPNDQGSDPINNIPQTEDPPQSIIKSLESKSTGAYVPNDQIPSESDLIQPETEPVQQNYPNSFGKSQKVAMNAPASNLGWKNIPISFLPSMGMFYPNGTKIAIRAAEVKEIRHYSTIDDADNLDIEEKLSYVLERCFKMEFLGEGVVSYKDLKQEDRFFIILAIRDLTFTKGENMIILKPYKKCKELPDCPFSAGIELRTGVLNSYEIDPKILQYYDEQTRCFTFSPKKLGKSINVYIPSIGVNQEITSFISECSKRKIEVDDGFISIAPFLFSDWRDLDFNRILGKMREIDNFWSKEEYSLYFELSERIKLGTKSEVKLECPTCGEKEVTASITFPGGLRSLFVITDIFGELF
jgi:hypothetical protein